MIKRRAQLGRMWIGVSLDREFLTVEKARRLKWWRRWIDRFMLTYRRMLKKWRKILWER